MQREIRTVSWPASGWMPTKRIVDVAASAILVCVLSPLFGVIALAVRLSMGLKVPVILRQARLGHQGQPFVLYKFRTMTEECDAQGNLLADEARLTRVGRVLRGMSLDELPELVNVLRGEMSLVGPRPLLPEYRERYSPRQWRRHEMKPGITGWARGRPRCRCSAGRLAIQQTVPASADGGHLDNLLPLTLDEEEALLIRMADREENDHIMDRTVVER